MAQNIKIGGSWQNVPGVLLPKEEGGQAAFVDPTVVTIESDTDVKLGKKYIRQDGSTGTGEMLTPSGSTTITSNGTWDVSLFETAVIAVPTGGGTPTLQAKTKTYTPTTSQQTEDVTPDSGYDGLSKVSVTVEAIQTESKSATPTESAQTITPSSGKFLSSVSVGAIPSNYVGTGITRRTSSSMTEAQGNITAPAGYYASDAVFEMQDVGHPDPTISVSSGGLITASLTQPEGWTQGGNASATRQLDTDAGGTYTPNRMTQHVVQAETFVTGDVYVNPIPGEYIIPTGTTTISENGEYDVVDFETAIVNVAAAAGGLEYETGIWTPGSDIARGTISFSDSHSEPPVAIILADATGTASSATNSNHMFVWFDVQRFTGHGFPYSSSGFRYAAAYYSYRGSSTSSISSAGYLCSQQTTSSSASGVTYPKYWATVSEFHPYSNSTSRYWRSGRSYKWIAIWKP